MIDWLFFLIILAMPWKLEYYTQILDVPVVWSNACCHGTACYYDGTVYLKHEWLVPNAHRDIRLRHAISHELNHHFATEEWVWGNGGQAKFRGVIRDLIISYPLTHEQRFNIKSMLAHESAFELHAELPWLLKGEIPQVLDDWYPWFEEN